MILLIYIIQEKLNTISKVINMIKINNKILYIKDKWYKIINIDYRKENYNYLVCLI